MQNAKKVQFELFHKFCFNFRIKHRILNIFLDRFFPEFGKDFGGPTFP